MTFLFTDTALTLEDAWFGTVCLGMPAHVRTLHSVDWIIVHAHPSSPQLKHAPVILRGYILSACFPSERGQGLVCPPEHIREQSGLDG